MGRVSLIKFRIDAVNEEHNTAVLKVGDIVTLYSGCCLEFKDADARFDFFSDNIGREIRDNDTLHAEEVKAMKVTESKGYKGEGYFVSNAEMFELIPKKGVNYWQDFSSKEDYPLQEGESYTLFISNDNVVYECLDKEKAYHAQYAMPLNEELSYEKLNEKYGYWLAPKMNICEEIAALFK